MSHHSTKCPCHNGQDQPSSGNEELYAKTSDSSRREFLKKAAGLGLSLGIGAGSPPPVSALRIDNGAFKSREIFGNASVKNGRTGVMTILHTADIHAQLFTHDEFFMENGKPVFKKRGGFATLKTMLNELRNQNPGNTLVIDGGD